MKQHFSKSKVLDTMGLLDKNEQGEYILRVESDDDVEIYRVKEDILDKILGQEVTIKSIREDA